MDIGGLRETHSGIASHNRRREFHPKYLRQFLRPRKTASSIAVFCFLSQSPSLPPPWVAVGRTGTITPGRPKVEGAEGVPAGEFRGALPFTVVDHSVTFRERQRPPHPSFVIHNNCRRSEVLSCFVSIVPLDSGSTATSRVPRRSECVAVGTGLIVCGLWCH